LDIALGEGEGAGLPTVTFADRLVGLLFVQLLAVEFSLQEMASPAAAEMVARSSVLRVPGCSAPFLCQLKVRAVAFSVSESGSVKSPGLQVAMEAA
jgi:hypothetical protein